MFYCYILLCSDDSYYAGVSDDPQDAPNNTTLAKALNGPPRVAP